MGFFVSSFPPALAKCILLLTRTLKMMIQWCAFTEVACAELWLKVHSLCPQGNHSREWVPLVLKDGHYRLLTLSIPNIAIFLVSNIDMVHGHTTHVKQYIRKKDNIIFVSSQPLLRYVHSFAEFGWYLLLS